MASKAITEKPEGPQMPGDWRPSSESAPSLLREDDLVVPRIVGMVGAAAAIFGGMALGFHIGSGGAVRLPYSWALLLLIVGLAGLLYHAAFDRDLQFRRLYMVLGFVGLAAGALLCVHPYLKRESPSFRYGFLSLAVSPLFLLAFLRNETETRVRDIVQYLLGGAGALLAALGLFGGNLRGEFLLPAGLLFALLGLFYLAAFIASRGVSDDLAYRAAQGVGAVGLLVVLVALLRSFLPDPPGVVSYFKTFGFLLLLVGFAYLAVSYLLCSDRPLAVLTRRELSAFFFSPIAYLTLFGFTVTSWVSYREFLGNLIDTTGPVFEPIVRSYLFALFPVIVLIFSVPALTMRLLSEEYRSGTLEVLLTAPVDESVVVFSKFLAAFLTNMFTWVPFWLFLLAIPLGGGSPFDYRPLLSFFIAMSVSMAGFAGMGLFFSTLTRSQIASGVLTFAGMLALTFAWFAAQRAAPESAWEVALKHVSYLDLWLSALGGKLSPRGLLFFASMTVLFLFLSVKVLESRKWR
jgi:hypothetical protein